MVRRRVRLSGRRFPSQVTVHEERRERTHSCTTHQLGQEGRVVEEVGLLEVRVDGHSGELGQDGVVGVADLERKTSLIQEFEFV